MKMSRRLFLSVWLASVAACSGHSAWASDPAYVRIGVLLPLSGEFAAWGEGVRRAIELYGEDARTKLRFEFEDEGNCEAQKALAGYRKMTSSGVNFLIVGCLSGTKAILPIAKKEKVVLFSVGLVDDSAFKQTSQLINLATQLSTESRYLAERVAQRGFRRIAIIHWIDPFSNEFAETLARSLRERGSEVVFEEGIDPKDNDYRSLLLRIKRLAPDAICFNVGQDQQDVLLRQIRQLGITAAVFSNYVFETPAVLKLGEVLANVEYSFPLNSAEGSPKNAEYDRQFELRFGSGAKPTPNSYFVRDGLALFEEALTKCTGADPECIATIFKSTKNYAGLSGDLSFHSDGSNDRPYGIKKVEKGQFSWVGQ